MFVFVLPFLLANILCYLASFQSKKAEVPSTSLSLNQLPLNKLNKGLFI